MSALAGPAFVAPNEGVTVLLADWVARLEFDAIPRDVLAHAKTCMLDGLGCGVFGSRQPWGRIAAETALEFSRDGRSSLFGRSETVSPPDAAMANGTALHGFEIDDIHVSSSFHPASVVLPAVLAVAEAEGCNGRDVVTALVAGYEAGIRLGIAAGIRHSTSGYHVTGTVGTLAAAAATARLLGLDAERTAHALGLGLTQAAGLYAARLGAMAKRFHAGRASQSGVLAGYLARNGFTGSTNVIEAEFGGFMSTMNGEGPASGVLAELGSRWETCRVGFKIYAACASAHTIIDALDSLMEAGLTPENLAALEIGMSRKGALNVGWRYRPGEVVSAQMNGYYAAAVKLLDGAAFVEQYQAKRLADPRLLDLISRMEIRHDPTLDAGGASRRHAVNVRATRTDGQVDDVHVEQRTGSAERPLSHQDIEDKFRRLCRPYLSGQDIDDVVCLVARFEDESGTRALMHRIAGEPAAATGASSA